MPQFRVSQHSCLLLENNINDKHYPGLLILKAILGMHKMVSKNKIDESIRKHALLNAIQFSGKPNPGAVLGKLIMEYPEQKANITELKKEIEKVLSDISNLSVEEMKQEIEEKNPELLEKKDKKEKEQRNIFEFLGIKEGDKIVTAFPPEPSKYPHIGHAKAILINYELSQKYKGKFVLRFEDTNPELAKKEFYDIHEENYKWLGIKWNKLEYASDYMEKFYTLAEKLIKQNDAYVCTCEQDKIKDDRMKRQECDCRTLNVEENLNLWKAMKQMDEGQAIVRLKADMKSDNTAMRDPALLRIIKTPHVRTKTKYTIWPAYDFENSVMDGLEGVTHRLRSKEFELRNELQRFIQEKLGFPQTKVFEFARFNMEGVESSGRIIRDKIEKGELVGWDDPSLTTLVALKRRGFLPEAIKSFVLSTGITKSESTLTWDDLVIHNKRLLDKTAKRYFFVGEAAKVRVIGCPQKTVMLKYHPQSEAKERKFSIDGDFIIEKNDFEQIEDGSLYRFMDCINFRRKDNEFLFVSEEVEDYKKQGKKIMHWLPIKDDLIPAQVMMPDKKVISGRIERSAINIKIGDVVQFERFGFCRLDKIEKEKRYFYYSHK